MDDEDLVLLARWRGGDRGSGEALFSRHFADIHRFFEHKVGADADELTQRTFLACTAARDQFRAQSSFRTYLFTIARHEFYAYLKGRAVSPDVDFSVASLADLITTPATRIARAQEAARLGTALSCLPTDQQMLLELHYWHDLDAAALAEVFAIAPGAVRVRLLRARRALRDLLASGASVPGEAGDPLTRSLSDAALDSVTDD
jgi:RNA polymerase sigma factor (sigma-70 family)